MDIKMDAQGRIVSAVAIGLAAVQAQAQLLTASIRSTLLMRLGLYALSALFVITAALLVVFAPDGRETTTVVIAVALFALAIGSAGFGAFAIKTPLVSAEAGSGVVVLPSSEPSRASASESAATSDIEVKPPA